MLTDPERPWTSRKFLCNKVKHSNVTNELVDNCNIHKNKIHKKYHLNPNICVNTPNKLSTNNTEQIVTNSLDNVEKCIMRIVILAMMIYVLLNPMIYAPIILHEKIIQGFMTLMNVLYELRIGKYMYLHDHDNMKDMVFCKFNAAKMLNLAIKTMITFDRVWSKRIYRTCLKMLSKNFVKKRKNVEFFTHNKRPCPMQILTAETTWSRALSRSKGQTEVTPPPNCQHPVASSLFMNKKEIQVKNSFFESKNGFLNEPKPHIFKIWMLRTREKEKLKGLIGNNMIDMHFYTSTKISAVKKMTYHDHTNPI